MKKRKKLKKCPTCGDDYVHRREVLYIPDTDEGKGVPVSLFSERGVGEVVVTLGREPVRASMRGSELRQSFECENGHLWVEVSSFHKGNIHEEVLSLPSRIKIGARRVVLTLKPFECLQGRREDDEG
jgi:hypothetical protein